MFRILSAAALSLPLLAAGQHTFSIVAVDTVTRQVGSAGASCIDTTNSYNINRINEIVPGRGAINAQADWDFVNLANAKTRMLAGDSPQQIITWLNGNDAKNDPQRMQYGIADLSNGQPRSAAFSGIKALDFKGHKLGRNYSVQGNILIGARVLDSIEAGFLRTSGTLADKLMAALQGAAFAGADRRCLNEGVSSRSAFIRMALPTNTNGAYALDLNVPARAYGVEPIRLLQTLYDTWKRTTGVMQSGLNRPARRVGLFSAAKVALDLGDSGTDQIALIDPSGRTLWTQGVGAGRIALVDMSRFPNGIYWANLYGNGIRIETVKILRVR